MLLKNRFGSFFRLWKLPSIEAFLKSTIGKNIHTPSTKASSYLSKILHIPPYAEFIYPHSANYSLFREVINSNFACASQALAQNQFTTAGRDQIVSDTNLKHSNETECHIVDVRWCLKVIVKKIKLISHSTTLYRLYPPPATRGNKGPKPWSVDGIEHVLRHKEPFHLRMLRLIPIQVWQHLSKRSYASYDKLDLLKALQTQPSVITWYLI